jgi:ABC-type uncharacterized transport system permease subunit
MEALAGWPVCQFYSFAFAIVVAMVWLRSRSRAGRENHCVGDSLKLQNAVGVRCL